MDFENFNHSSSVLLGLNKLRNENKHCDVVLTVDGGYLFPAHKSVLSVCSPFFEAMFNGMYPESNQREIHMKAIDKDSLEIILSYMYTGKLQITGKNVQNLLESSSFLQIEWIEEKCCEFLLEYIEPNNCIGIKYLAEKNLLQELKRDVMKFTVKNFNQVSETEEFLSIEIEYLIQLLSDNEIFNHEEDLLFSSIIKWVQHLPQTRSAFLSDLLKFVHPLLISKDLVKTNKDLIMADPLCSEWCARVLLTDEQQNNILEWNIFVLDKIGKTSDLFRYGLKSKQFIPLNALPLKAFAVSLVGHKHSLYVQGGAIERKSTKNCFHYNMYRDKWILSKPLRLARSHHRSVILNNFIYAIGGNGIDGPMSSVECCDLTTGQTMMVESMLDSRTSMGAIVHENCLYVMGGENEDECLYSLERFDPREGNWTELESMNQVNSYCSSAVVLDAIYCSEGLGNSMERYDFRANQWHLIEFPGDREFYELFAINDELYSISSIGAHRYCPISNDWMSVFDFPIVHEWDTAVPLQMQQT